MANGDLSQDDVNQLVQRRFIDPAALSAANQPPDPSPSQEQDPNDPNVGVPVKKTRTAQLSPQSTADSGGYIPETDVPQLKQYDIPKPSQYGLGPGDQFKSNFEVFKNPIVILAGLGSLLTRRPLLAAMSFATGAMNGYNEGQIEGYKRQKDQFDDALKSAMDQNKVELDRYNAAWDRKKEFDWNKVGPRLYNEAARNKDELLMAAVNSHNWPLVEKIISGREAAQSVYDRTSQRLQAKADFDRQMSENLPPGIPDLDTAKFIARQFIKGDRQAMTGYFRSQGAKAFIEKMAKNILTEEMGMNDDQAAQYVIDQSIKLAGQRQQEIVAATAEPRALGFSLRQATSQRTAIANWTKSADRAGQLLVSLGQKVDSTGIPAVERWIRAGRREIMGDPDVNNFNAQANIYKAEVAKIITNPNLTGVLTDHARNEANSFLSDGIASRQLLELVPLLKRDMNFRTEALDEQITQLNQQLKSHTIGAEPAEEKADPLGIR